MLHLGNCLACLATQASRVPRVSGFKVPMFLGLQVRPLLLLSLLLQQPDQLLLHRLVLLVDPGVEVEVETKLKVST